MNLYIEIENGAPKNHPALEENILQAFGFIPSNWEPFVRVKAPEGNYFKTLVSMDSVYTKINGVWTDVWSVRDTNEDEKAAYRQEVSVLFFAREYAENWSAWVFDEDTLKMQPPIPRPAPIEGTLIWWCGADNNWKEVPTRPEGQYKFDFIAWQWVEAV
jgi:hypothetical protein